VLLDTYTLVSRARTQESVYKNTHTLSCPHARTRCTGTHIHSPTSYLEGSRESVCLLMWWPRLVGSLKLYVSFAKEPYKKDYILQKRPIIFRSLLIVATPYIFTYSHAFSRPLSCIHAILLARSRVHTHTVCAYQFRDRQGPRASTLCNTLLHTATHCSTLQHTATHCNTYYLSMP